MVIFLLIIIGIAFALLKAEAQREFYSCTQARAAGFHDIPSTSPYYNSGLDKDNDGVACQL